MELPLLATVWLSAFISFTYSITPVEVVGSKFFVQGGSQFYIKGVNYIGQNATNTNVLTDGAQCALDAPAIKALGANAIRITASDNLVFSATGDYDSCMQSFADNGIYVFIPLTQNEGFASSYGPSPTANGTYDLSVYNDFTAIIDVFQKYDNTLGFEIFPFLSEYQDLLFKSIFRDLRAYRDANGFRPIPIGAADLFPSDDDTNTYPQSWVNFTFCPSPDSNGTIDDKNMAEFLGISSYSWCGSSSFQEAGYDRLNEAYGNLGAPIYFADTGCDAVLPRQFTDQAAIFGPEMDDIWSGAMIYEWSIFGPDDGYQLVTYSGTSSPATPTPLSDYSALSSQWATLTPAGTTRPSTKTYPSCPTTDGVWTIEPSATLPTIAGLVIATGSGSRTSGATGPSATSGGNHHSDKSSSGFPKGAAVGIGVGVGLLLILAIMLFVLFQRRKNKKKLAPPYANASSTGEKSEMYAGPVDVTMAGPVKPKSELYTSGAITRKPVSSELHGYPSVTAQSHELQGPTGANAPWVHSDTGYTPRELNSSPIFEAGQGRFHGDTWYTPPELNSNPIFEVGQGRYRGTTNEGYTSYGDASRTGVDTAPQDRAPHRTGPGYPTTGGEVAGYFPGASDQPEFDDSELAEEADIAVQELGLISVRKRNLTSSAAAAGVRPEDLPGRKGEEYAELLQREQRVRGRLDEIERQRRHLMGQ